MGVLYMLLYAWVVPPLVAPPSLRAGIRPHLCLERFVSRPDPDFFPFGDWGDPGARLQLPRRDSIARLLVNAWLAENP